MTSASYCDEHEKERFIDASRGDAISNRGIVVPTLLTKQYCTSVNFRSIRIFFALLSFFLHLRVNLFGDERVGPLLSFRCFVK